MHTSAFWKCKISAPERGGGTNRVQIIRLCSRLFSGVYAAAATTTTPPLSSSDFPMNSINSRYNFISFAVSCSSFHILHILHSSNYSPRGQEIQLLTTFRASRHISSRRIASFHMYWLIYLFSFTLEVFNVDWIFQVKFSTWWGGEFYPSPP